MARLRPINVINILSFEEKTRATNFFMLLVEIDARLPKTTKTKKRAAPKVKPMPCLRQGYGRQTIKQKPCSIKCPAICCSSITGWRDLYLIDIVLKLVYYIILQ